MVRKDGFIIDKVLTLEHLVEDVISHTHQSIHLGGMPPSDGFGICYRTKHAKYYSNVIQKIMIYAQKKPPKQTPISNWGHSQLSEKFKLEVLDPEMIGRLITLWC